MVKGTVIATSIVYVSGYIAVEENENTISTALQMGNTAVQDILPCFPFEGLSEKC